MKKPTAATPPRDPSVASWGRARDIVEFFVVYRHRQTVDAFLAQYEGPQDHDAIRDAFRLYAPEFSSQPPHGARPCPTCGSTITGATTPPRDS
jgi:hypothetical protein